MVTPLRTWWQRHGLLVGLFAPPAVWVAVRWWLNFQLERQGLTLPPALSPAADPDTTLRWVALGVGLALAVGGLVAWLMRASTPARARRRVGWALLAVWLLLWVAGAAQTGRSHLNRLQPGPAREVTVRVVAVQVQVASVRSAGGAKVYLDWPEGGGLHTVVLESPSEALLRQPPGLVLRLAPGRWSGQFVLGWRVDNAAPVPSSSARPTP